ncbi:MAG TPA: ABC transporter permease, partial [Vicinamibacterales bacterium]|nr:ABC transporter permease [Vicinamibacterales bacterium]
MPTDALARVVVSVLRRILPAGQRDDVLGDLLEHYHRRGKGRRLWLVREAAGLIVGLRRRSSSSGFSEGAAADVWRGDLRYALRSLRRAPSSSIVAITSLALGVGLTTAVYSVLDGVLLRPLPYTDSDRIVHLRQIQPDAASGVADDVSRALLGQWMLETERLESITAFGVDEKTLSFGPTKSAALVADVSPGFFEVMHTRPAHGRLFTTADTNPTGPCVVLLGHAYWLSVMGGDDAVVNQSMVIESQTCAIAGVLPASFTYPSSNVAVYRLTHYVWPDPTLRRSTASFGVRLTVLGRMKHGAAAGDVAAEGDRVWGRLRAAGAYSDTTVRPTFSVRRLQDELAESLRPALLVLMAAVSCVLVITCVNLTNLLLARGTVRQREMALRAALGASRWGMSRALAFESLIVGLAGGALGLAIAWAVVQWLPELTALDAGVAQQVRLDGRILVFTMALTAVISVIFGVLPAWQAPAGRVKEALSATHVHLLPGASLKAEHLRSALVVIQVALAIVLVVTAALLARSLVGLLRVDLGFNPDRAITFQVRMPPPAGREYGWQLEYYNHLITMISHRPGVAAAGFTTSLPMMETYSNTTVRIDGVPPPEGLDRAQSHREVVSPEYFAAIGLRVLAGRGFTDSDTAESEHVIVVNETFARTFLPGRDPIGHRVMSFGRDWYRIVGVVSSKRHSGPSAEPRPEFYNVLRQMPVEAMIGATAGFAVRGQGDVNPLWPMLRAESGTLLPDAPIFNETVMSERVWRSSA